MNRLVALEAESIFILREAYRALTPMAMLWSFGKDSNVLVHLCRKAFFGKVPFPVLHCDTGLEFDEVYAFRDQYAKKWNIDLRTIECPALEATDASLPASARVAARKTLGLKEALNQYGFKAILSGIRRDEEPTRAKERIFSPRAPEGAWQITTQPPEFWGHYNTQVPEGGHVRVHPLLHWSEADIWHYTAQENIPLVPLYFAKPYHQFEGRDFGGASMRFRSLGEKSITWPVASNASTIEDILTELDATRVPERSGRPMGADEDESAFERLRTDGYM